MKKTLLLALLSVPLVLTACAKNKAAAAATSTAVASAQNAAFEAPANVTGKTIVISFQNAISRYCDDEETGWSAWSTTTSYSPIAITFNGNNSHSKIIRDHTGHPTYNTRAAYAKASSKTAVIKYIHNDMVADGGYWDFVLNFTTPNSGTATWEDEAGCTKTEGKNATFIIK